MKFLICGLGSIGQRHARNLKKILPKCEIIAYRSTLRNVGLFEKELQIKTFKSLDLALKEKPIAAFITNPTSLHIKTAISCAKKGVHLFIEKPLSNSLKGIKQLEDLISKNRLILMVGFMMRYNPGIIKIKKLLDKKIIGDVISAQIINGEYLPNWHPNEDYRKSYSARKDLGGGIILNFTHELDYASLFFGPVETIFCLTNKSKILKTDVEDSAEILINYQNNVKAYIHLDQISQPSIRTVSIIGDKGRIYWDYFLNTVKWYRSDNCLWYNYRYKFDRNQMFTAELKHFLKSINQKKIPQFNMYNAQYNLSIALAAKKSAITGRRIKL